MITGDLVVCVNNGIIHGAWNRELHRICVGHVYTIGDVYDPPAYISHAYPEFGSGIRLVEVPIAWWWHSARFRLCRKTNIDALVACTKEHEMENV